jgi:hypothetical protein
MVRVSFALALLLLPTAAYPQTGPKAKHKPEIGTGTSIQKACNRQLGGERNPRVRASPTHVALLNDCIARRGRQ